MPAGSSVLTSARIQRRVIGALLLRELLTRFGRRNLGFLWLFIEPMLFTAGVLGIWTLYHQNRTPFPLTAFCISGYGSVLLWRNTIGRSGNAVEPNRALMHHRNVRVLDLFVARIVLEISGASISFLVLTTVLGLLGVIAPPADIASMIVAWVLLAWFSAAMALIVGPLATISEPFERFWHVFAYLFLPASGAFFTISMLPVRLQAIAAWIPTVNCTELLRAGLFGPTFEAHYSVYYMVMLNLALMIPGMLLVRHLQTTAEGE